MKKKKVFFQTINIRISGFFFPEHKCNTIPFYKTLPDYSMYFSTAYFKSHNIYMGLLELKDSLMPFTYIKLHKQCNLTTC